MTTAALYARVSTADQSCAAQLDQLRAYAQRRGFELQVFSDEGISGAKLHRLGLNAMMLAARRRAVDVVIITKLDRLFRSVSHLVSTTAELHALGVELIVLDQAIDTTTPAGRLMFHVLGAMAEFERDLIRERVTAGMRRAQTHGTRSGRGLGRPRKHWIKDLGEARELWLRHGLRPAARLLGVHPSALARAVHGDVSAHRVQA